MWQTLAEWFQKAGYELVFCNAGITRGSVEIFVFLMITSTEGTKSSRWSLADC
jgi:hypothetical protein